MSQQYIEVLGIFLKREVAVLVVLKTALLATALIPLGKPRVHMKRRQLFPLMLTFFFLINDPQHAQGQIFNFILLLNGSLLETNVLTDPECKGASRSPVREVHCEAECRFQWKFTLLMFLLGLYLLLLEPQFQCYMGLGWSASNPIFPISSIIHRAQFY